MYLYVTHMSLVCHWYGTRMYSFVIRWSLVCTRMSLVCHSYLHACHSYGTCICFYHEPRYQPKFEKPISLIILKNLVTPSCLIKI